MPPVPQKRGVGRMATHHRGFGDDWSRVTCGRTSGYVKRGDEIPYRRTTVKLTGVTCAECLVLVIQTLKRLLHGLKPERGVVRQAHGRVAMGKLAELVRG